MVVDVIVRQLNYILSVVVEKLAIYGIMDRTHFGHWAYLEATRFLATS